MGGRGGDVLLVHRSDDVGMWRQVRGGDLGVRRGRVDKHWSLRGRGVGVMEDASHLCRDKVTQRQKERKITFSTVTETD